MRKIVLAAGAVIIGVFVGFIFRPLISGDNIYQQLKKFDQVLQTANKNYVEEVDSQRLVESAIKGMLDELDPHSVYISPEQNKSVDEDLRKSSFEGIGVEFDIIADTVTVISPIPGGPSDSLGIMSGDKIVMIDGENAVGISRTEVPKKLKGPKGSKVEVDIARPGEDELLHFSIVRAKIPRFAVQTYFMIDDTDIGMIKLGKFSSTTHEEVVDAMRNLKKQGMKKLILDLRGNPGGYLSQAYYVADELIPNNNTIVYTKGRRRNFNETKASRPGGTFEKKPLIVLIDASSASASEIVSGAVQDLDRGLVVGETSFGKGLVQREWPLNDGSAFRITISKYYTPSGRCIQRPYDNEKEYRSLVGRLDLNEGGNINHTFEKLKKQFADESDIQVTKKYLIIKSTDENKNDSEPTLDSLPIHYTKKGRPVLGGGGITPDFIVKYDTITKMSRKIRNKRMFTQFVDSYMGAEGKQLREKWEGDFGKFKTEFDITQETLGRFRKFVQGKGIKWIEEDGKKDRPYFENTLKAYIALSIWERRRFLEILFLDDRMLNKAIELFPEAKKLASLN